MTERVSVIVEHGVMSEDEVKHYIAYIQKLNRGKTLKSLELLIGDFYVDMKYTFAELPFQRIRRVETGSAFGVEETNVMAQ